MFKWGLIFLGIFFLWGGIDNHLNYSDNINEKAETINFDKLEKLLTNKETRYIRYTGNLDPTGQIYPTFINRPKYTSYGLREVNNLSASSLLKNEAINEYLGSNVKVDLPLDSTQIEIQYIREKGNTSTHQSSTYIAPLAGTNGAIWVLSPGFNMTEKEKQAEWLSKKSFTGRLSRLSDLNANVEKLSKNVGEITSLYTQKTSNYVSPNAVVILANREMAREGDAKVIKYYNLVEDTDLLLYAEISDSDKIEKGSISGILNPKDSKYYAGFKTALDESSLPPRIGIISQETGKEINEDNLRVTKIGIFGGIVMILLGVFLIRRKTS